MSENDNDLVGLSAEIVGAYVAYNNITRTDLPGLIESTHAALAQLGAEPFVPIEVPLVPAVPIKKSVTLDAIICLEDGKKFKALKRHLRTAYDMTPKQYRAKWGLPSDYPMVAPSYAEKRSALAKAIGLGQRGAAPSSPTEVAAEAPASSKRRRPKIKA